MKIVFFFLKMSGIFYNNTFTKVKLKQKFFKDLMNIVFMY